MTKTTIQGAFVSKISDAETEAGEMQCWMDVALKLAYMSQEDYKRFNERYEHLLTQLITMLNNADRWCTL